jgi:glutamate dehydrogenase
LADNILQTQALSLAVAEGSEALERHARLMRNLERAHRLDRIVEFLPDDKTLALRSAAKIGLTRPELAVLLAYAKNAIYDALLAGTVPDDHDLDDELLRYFPTSMQAGAVQAGAMQGPPVLQHRLRREIIATSLANELVNRMGISFVAEMLEPTVAPTVAPTGTPIGEATGAKVDAITRAFLIVREVFELPSVWAAIAALDNVAPAATQMALLLKVGAAAEQAVRWFVTSGVPLNIAARRREFGAGFSALATSHDVQPAPERWAGVPDALATRVAALTRLVTCMDVVQIAEATGVGVVAAGQVYFAVGEGLGLSQLRAHAYLLPVDTVWARMARDALVQDCYTMQRRLAQNVVTEGNGLAAWRARRAPSIAGLEVVLTEMVRAERPELALLSVVSRRIAELS